MLSFISQVGRFHSISMSDLTLVTAYARNMLVPDSECFQANVRSTYNIVEAACKLGVKKIIIASSETTYGVCFAQGDTEYHSFPLEEDYDVDPEDTYVYLLFLERKKALRSRVPDMHSRRYVVRRQRGLLLGGSRTISMHSESVMSSSRMSMSVTSRHFSRIPHRGNGMPGVILMREILVRFAILLFRRVDWGFKYL